MTLNKTRQETLAGCAAACAALRGCSMVTWCPANSSVSCEMDALRTIEPPGTCYLLQQTALPSSPIMPVFAIGAGVATVAGAPLSPQLAGAPLRVGGYEGQVALNLFAAAEGTPIGILKAADSPVPANFSFNPSSTTYWCVGRVSVAAPPPPGPSAGFTPPLPQQHRADDITWSVLRRPHGALHTTSGGSTVIVAPHTFLPGTQVAGLAVGQRYDGCAARCVAYPDCHSFSWCPSSASGSCALGGLGVPSYPPGACVLLYEQSVVDSNGAGIAILAHGEGLTMLGGVPVVANPNLTVPGYQQHLGQSMLGAYDVPPDLCPGSMHLMQCRVVGSLQEIADVCSAHPNCSAFTWREVAKPGLPRGGTGNLKCGAPFDPRRISWNPGTILFVQDSVPLPQAAPLPCSALHEEEPCSDGPPAAREAAGGLGVGAIAGAALGAAAAAAAALAAAVWWRRRRRHARPPLLLKAHASMPSELPELQLAENRALAANGSRLVEVSSMSQVISTPRRRAGSSPSQRALAAAPAPAAPASLQAGRSGTDLVVHASSPEPPTPAAQAGPHTGSIGEQGQQGSREALVARLLAASPWLEEALVPEEAVTFMQASNGRPAVLGQGGFGAVFKVLLRGHTVCAAKILEWEGADHLQTMFVQEAAMMRRLLHPNIVQFMGICVAEQRGMLLQEYCAGRDLDVALDVRSRVTGGRLLDWNARGRRIAADIAAGMAYLHGCSVVHLPHNILLTREWAAKIGDVGLARLFNRTHLSVGGQFGTFDYCAPEVLLGRGATPASDVFSYGVVLFQIATGERPRRGQLRELRAPQECPQAIADLQQRCVQEDPAQRPSAAEVHHMLRQADVQFARERMLPSPIAPSDSIRPHHHTAPPSNCHTGRMGRPGLVQNRPAPRRNVQAAGWLEDVMGRPKKPSGEASADVPPKAAADAAAATAEAPTASSAPAAASTHGEPAPAKPATVAASAATVAAPAAAAKPATVAASAAAAAAPAAAAPTVAAKPAAANPAAAPRAAAASPAATSFKAPAAPKKPAAATRRPASAGPAGTSFKVPVGAAAPAASAGKKVKGKKARGKAARKPKAERGDSPAATSFKVPEPSSGSESEGDEEADVAAEAAPQPAAGAAALAALGGGSRAVITLSPDAMTVNADGSLSISGAEATRLLAALAAAGVAPATRSSTSGSSSVPAVAPAMVPRESTEMEYLTARTASVQQHFETALGADDFIQRVEMALHGFGFNGGNSIAMVNLCRDEVTATLKQKVDAVFGASFSTNGLGGVLTCGAVGMGAGFSHSPVCSTTGKERYVFFSFPHISINSKGEVGPMSRPGRPGQSCACGALIKAHSEIREEGLVCNCKIPGVHDAVNPEYSILKQRIARRLRHEGETDESVKKLSLTDITKVAERTISDDLEFLISKSVDTSKADYAVITGVQIHNWAHSFEDDSPNMEYVAPTSTYVVVNGVKTHLDLLQVPPLTPRQIRLLHGGDHSVVCNTGGATVLHEEDAPYTYDNKDTRRDQRRRLERYVGLLREEGLEGLAAVPPPATWQQRIVTETPQRCARADNSTIIDRESAAKAAVELKEIQELLIKRAREA
ncbi:low-CO2 inducible isoform B [Micractinium conductrix]|uniref:Low-CO2 inducible isoform B n=1 Tax=Micractinium conductrix TaxID=554055 RepID=A0A2P6VI36_9CHLO|nr:low-CO2 inducible isoform B [Micractinium conductrix]|eukprot:PSC73738.1 low-CO2 inducible isoform B [Micractinium conductrix]